MKRRALLVLLATASVPFAFACGGPSTPATTPATEASSAPADTSSATAAPTDTTPPPAASSAAPAPPPAPTAHADLQSKSGTKITGDATFTEATGGVSVTINVKGAAPGTHGVHLHETPDCTAADAKSAGAHWNPDHAQHGAPDAASHHAGDFGNVTVGADGTGTLTLTVSGLTVAPGDHSVVGRSVIVHANADDLKSQPAGNAGARGACGVVTAS